MLLLSLSPQITVTFSTPTGDYTNYVPPRQRRPNALMSQFSCNGHHRHAPESMQSWCVQTLSEQSDEMNSLTKQRNPPNQQNQDFARNSNVINLMGVTHLISIL